MNSAQQLVRKGYNIILEEGISEFFKKSARFTHINLVRPYLPKGEYPKMNEILVSSEKHRYTIFDRFAPWNVPSNPGWSVSFDNYKNESVSLIKEYVREGDRVIVIGGGFGISTITAAREVGPNGQVISYEGSKSRFDTLRKTIEINDISNATAKHSIVGSPIKIAGDSGNASIVDPSELNDFDVLEMDCEGAEISILESLSYKPRLILVETHPENGSPTEDIEQILRDYGYEIKEKKPDPGSGDVILAKMAG